MDEPRVKNQNTNVSISPQHRARLKRLSAELGISYSECVRRLIDEEWDRRQLRDGPPSD